MFDSVTKYVNTCITCQRIKPFTKSQYATFVLYLFHTIAGKRLVMTHDLITSLPRTLRGYIAILTFEDTLSKRAIFASCQGSILAEGCANIFFQQVFRHLCLPKGFISAIDSSLTLQFCQSFFKHLGTSFSI